MFVLGNFVLCDIELFGGHCVCSVCSSISF